MTTHVENRRIRRLEALGNYNNRIIEINALIASDETRLNYLNEFYEKYFSAYGYEHFSHMDLTNPPSIYEDLFIKDDNLKILYIPENEDKIKPNLRQLILEEKKYCEWKIVSLPCYLLNNKRDYICVLIPSIYKSDFLNITSAELKNLRKDVLSMRRKELTKIKKAGNKQKKKEQELDEKIFRNGFTFR